MTVAAPPRTRRIALVGNPNCGKTTIFNQLTGFRERTGNYAGVTVERRAAPLRGAALAVEVVDLPGMYSIAARSPDEMVSVDVLLGNRRDSPEPPDALLLVADASNLERNLFLATQAMEAGLPWALLLNMSDVAASRGAAVDPGALAERLGAPVFPVVGTTGQGLDAVRAWVAGEDFAPPPAPPVRFPPEFEAAAAKASDALAAMGLPPADRSPFLVRRALLETAGMAEKRIVQHGGAQAAAALEAARSEVQGAGLLLLSLEARTRYAAIRALLEGLRSAPGPRRATATDRIDRVLLHPVWGALVFVAVMLVVFQAIFAWSAPFMDVIEGLFGALGDGVEAALPEGPVAAFLSGGVIAGVGAVVVFLPQIVVLFLFIALLEDSGYMARAAFLADRLFSRFGLSGRGFIPLLGSFACAIPGIMATRTIPDHRDRLATILVAPFMSCSARLPVYALMIAAFIPAERVAGLLNLQGLVLLGMYLLGPVVALATAVALRRTVLRGPAPSFLMELPPYRVPLARVVGAQLAGRAGAFLKTAGTIIFAVSIVIWAAAYYPRPASIAEGIESAFAERIDAAADEDERDGLAIQRDNAIASAYLGQSYLGRAGKLIEPVVAPLGWDWRIGMAVVASFPAREVVVAALGVIFEAGEVDEESPDLRSKLQSATRPDGSPLFTIPVAVSIMVFFALCSQCAATLAVIRRETNSWRWPLFSFLYMTILAWIGAFLAQRILALLLG